MQLLAAPRSRWIAAGAVVAAGALLLFRQTGNTVLPPASSLDRYDNLALLQPKFRSKIQTLISRMRARGFDAFVFETWRSRARNKELSARGTGIAPRADGTVPIGMHELGLAVDIISQSAMWNTSSAFKEALGQEAKALGLSWGGTWTSKKDYPHVQGVTPAQQGAAVARFRLLGYNGVEA